MFKYTCIYIYHIKREEGREWGIERQTNGRQSDRQEGREVELP
jgi:hypothetical protein